MEKKSQSVFQTLNNINVNGHTEKKNGLTYLSWAWAWAEVKKHYPEAFYKIYENAQGIPYFNDGMTCWVKTGVTINNIEHIEYLPIMDFRNRSIPLGQVTSMDMNKSIQRSLTKACARHGLGLYIYAGEDLPESEQATPVPAAPVTPAAAPIATAAPADPAAVVKAILNAKSRKELGVIWNTNVAAQAYPEVTEAMKIACAKYPKTIKTA